MPKSKTSIPQDKPPTKTGTRRDYPEQRIVAIGYLRERLHILCFTPTSDGIRVISFRKANKREGKSYESQTTD